MPIGSVLLFLSRRQRLRRWMETSPLAARLTSRFVAGLTVERALAVCRKLSTQGILATLDHLGENVTSLAQARASRDAYLMALDRLAASSIRASVSIKLTQFGMDLSEDACRENVAMLVEKARECGNCIEIDMESREYVDRTLALVTAMHRQYGSVRGVIQAYLYRSEKDVESLCQEGIPVRLCKGAYLEPPTVAFPRKRHVNENYARLARILLDRGVYPGLATHDDKMIQAAIRHAADKGIAPDRFEFQMLYGIRRDLQRMLVAQGYRLRLYVPYGDAWFPYLMRRLAERPANIFFLARHALQR